MINLLPPAQREEKMYGRRNKSAIGYVGALFTTAFFVAAIMLGSSNFIAADEKSLRREIEDSTAVIDSLKATTAVTDTLVARMEVANKLYEGGVTFSELIPQIGALMPTGTIMNGLSLTGGKSDPLTLSIDLKEPELAAVIVRNLEESDLFEAADIGSITPLGEVNAQGYSYSATISASFTGAAEAKQKEKAAAAAKKAAEKAKEAN